MSKFKNLLKEKFKTLYFFYQYIGRKIYAVFSFSVLLVLMDSVGIALFIPLLQIADKNTHHNINENNDRILESLTNFFDFLRMDVTMVNMLLLIVAVFFIKSIFSYLANRFNSIAQQHVILRMRTSLGTGLKNLSFKEFVNTDVGRLHSSLISEVFQVTVGFTQYIEAIKNTLFVIIYLIFAFIIDWKFSLLVLLGGVVTNFIYKYFYSRTKQLSRAITKNNHRYGGLALEAINNYKYLSASGRKEQFFTKMQGELENQIDNNISVSKLNSKLNSLREPMTITVICIVIFIHVVVFQSTLSSVIIILLFFYRVMQKIMDVQNNWNSYLSQTGAIENIIDFKNYLNKNKDNFYNGKQPFASFETLTLDGISVTYGDEVVLKDISLSLNKNQHIAFVGESGSGKTTLVNLISALLPFKSGNFLYNEQDIRDVNIELYKQKIGYVSQEPTIFNASIYENITFWDKDNRENVEKFNKVISMCSLDKYIEGLPNGKDALLGNNGINISGGQKQRISIARELYREVDLIILDEATAALDSETENSIKESFEFLKGKVTIISIAHRLSTVKTADCLYLLDRGEIVANGTFEELKERSLYFNRLAELQGI